MTWQKSLMRYTASPAMGVGLRTCKIQKRHRRGELAGDAHTLMMPGQFGPIILVLVDMFRALFTTTISCMEWKFYDFRNTCMRHQVLAATLSLGCLR